jgi:hypothetical protein
MEFIRPIVEERSAKMKEFGQNWDDAPVRQPVLFDFCFYLYSHVIHAMGAQSDMLMWLMSEAKGVERSLEGWARRLLMLNFASIHSTSLVSCRSFRFSRDRFVICQSHINADVHTSIISPASTSGIYRTLSPRGRSSGRRGGLDEGWNGQNAQD